MFATQSTHKLLAGISQASHVLVQDSQNRALDRHLFNEAYLMHTSTSPQYAIIASCDVAAAMMEPPGGTALVEESILEALDFRRAMRKVDEEFGKDDGGSRSGAPRSWSTKASAAPTTGSSRARRAPPSGTASATWPTASTCSTRSSRTIVTPGPGPERQVRQDRHPGQHRHQVPGRARRDRGEDRASTASSSCSRSASPRAAGTRC